jgi:hypothetical protein
MEHVTPKEHHMWFDSMHELKCELPAMLARNRFNHDLFKSWPWKNTVDARRFYDCRSWSEAFEKCEQGWPQLLAKLQPMIKHLQSTLELSDVMAVQVATRRRKRIRADYGDTLDMHRVWAGDLDRAWERPVKRNRMVHTERYATIYVDLNMSFTQHTDDSLWRAALSVCLVDQLTRMGINTELWSGSSGTNAYPHDWTAPKSYWTGARVKEFTQPLSEERVAAMCHAAFFRTWGFAMIMASEFRTYQGLGSVVDLGSYVWPLREREAAGERMFRISQVYHEYTARAELHRIINSLKGDSREVA